jgi:hypothetical protein
VSFGGTGPYGTSKLAALGIAEGLLKVSCRRGQHAPAECLQSVTFAATSNQRCNRTHAQLQELQTVPGAADKVRVVALCPAIVTTPLLDSSSSMDSSASAAPSEAPPPAVQGSALGRAGRGTEAFFKAVWAHGMTPAVCAEQVRAGAGGRGRCVRGAFARAAGSRHRLSALGSRR